MASILLLCFYMKQRRRNLIHYITSHAGFLSIYLTVVSCFLTPIKLFAVEKNKEQTNTLQSCMAKNVDNENVRGRASTITFPNGRKITVVGHIHGDRQIYKIGEMINKDHNVFDKMTDDQFSDFFRKILEENSSPYKGTVTKNDYKSVLKKFKTKFNIDASPYLNVDNGFDLKDINVLSQSIQDYNYIKERLKHNHGDSQFSFIGWEGSQTNLENNYPLFYYYKHNLLLQFYGRNSTNKLKLTNKQFRESLLSSMNANTFVYIEDPELMRSIPLIGVENHEVGTLERESQPLKMMDSAFKDLIEADDKYWKDKSDDFKKDFIKNPSNTSFFSKLTLFRQNVVSMNIDSLDELEEQIQDLNSSSVNFPWIQSAMEKIFEACRLRTKSNLARNSNSSTALARINASGIHFVGLNHYRDIVKNLERLCTEESYQGAQNYHSTQSFNGNDQSHGVQ